MNLNEKSRMTSFILTVFFGPLGLLYTSVIGGLVLTIIAMVTFPTIYGPLICWFLAILIGDSAAHSHNKGVRRFEEALKARG